MWAFICAGGSFVFSFSDSFLLACIARFFIGLGASCGFIGTLKIGSLWLPANHMAKVVAFVYVSGMCGAILGSKPLEICLSLWSWRTIYMVLGLLVYL